MDFEVRVRLLCSRCSTSTVCPMVDDPEGVMRADGTISMEELAVQSPSEWELDADGCWVCDECQWQEAEEDEDDEDEECDEPDDEEVE